MDDNIEFKTVKELYNRVLPALYSKVKELRRMHLNYATEKDIWNYLFETSWKNKKNLELHELISDIIHADNYSINDYVMQKLTKYKNNEPISKIDNLN